MLVALLDPGATMATVLSGRYLDRLVRRDGTWRIAVRRSTVELMFNADARALKSPVWHDQGYLKGTRDTGDLSYERPLQLDSPAPERW